MREITTDVLVIGGGGAASRAAIAAYEAGAQVLMVMKGNFGKSGTTCWPVAELAGFNVPNGTNDPTDSPEVFFNDIMEAGLGMTDARLARILAEEVEEAKNDLERWGMEFARQGDRYLTIQGCFSSRNRMHIIKRLGAPIVNALKSHIATTGIKIMESVMVTDLIVWDGECVGAYGLAEDGEELLIKAKATILGTGGAGQLFKINLNPPDITGDGHAMAFRAGAELLNMEFMQAGLGIIWPIKNIFRAATLFMAYPRMYDKNGASFLEKHLPEGVTPKQAMDEKTHYPFSCRDNSRYLEISIMQEIRKGNMTEHRGVYFDFTHVDEAEIARRPEDDVLRKLWPVSIEWFLQKGFDLRKTPIEVTIFGHAVNGGVRIDPHAESSIKGLYAAGEVAAGPHGADRLGGNMLTMSQVFGKRAGRFAAERAKALGEVMIPREVLEEKRARVAAQRAKQGEITPDQAIDDLQEVLWANMLILKNAEILGRIRVKLAEMKEVYRSGLKVRGDRDVRKALEFEDLLTVAEIMTEAMDLRKESRGSHYRDDYPELNEAEWGQALSVTKSGDGFELKKVRL
ncbi:MAG: FAD-binding protein [Bacillota bacterium]|nr:FAD-binding protein [Bacillota bacterium]